MKCRIFMVGIRLTANPINEMNRLIGSALDGTSEFGEEMAIFSSQVMVIGAEQNEVQHGRCFVRAVALAAAHGSPCAVGMYYI
jgi:hypothetical protein